ncbi:MAG TPA: hypothetical protein VEJ44_06500, partial [Acidimicrobiales bacterium]|nr:hypothetical protein [Acidimicrobiales bacterium]
QLDGKVVSMLVNLPSGTHLAAAVGFVRAQLPPDARQTASWRGTFPITAAGPAAYCEFINYESDDLARSLGIPPPAAMAANIGVSFYQETGQRAGSSNIATVNTAAVSTAANVPGSSC